MPKEIPQMPGLEISGRASCRIDSCVMTRPSPRASEAPASSSVRIYL
jgi:hypothetical protein